MHRRDANDKPAGAVADEALGSREKRGVELIRIEFRIGRYQDVIEGNSQQPRYGPEHLRERVDVWESSCL